MVSMYLGIWWTNENKNKQKLKNVMRDSDVRFTYLGKILLTEHNDSS